jgi:hypothetical protein
MGLLIALKKMGVVVIGPAGSTAWELIVASTQFSSASDVPGLFQPVEVSEADARIMEPTVAGAS